MESSYPAAPSGNAPDEAARLEALRRYDILDTPPEENFDRLTRLATRLFDVSIALVSFVGAERQWMKSSLGLDRREMSREASFCAYAIQTPRKLMVVEDATEDERFVDNPLVADAPHVRFYAGAPLREPEGGHALGTLCVLDSRLHVLRAEDRQALEDLAETVMDELELRRELVERRRCEELLAAKTSLLNSMSHELRTPLASVIGFAEVIAENKISDEERREFAAIIGESGERLQETLESVLRLARLDERTGGGSENGRLERELVDVSAVARLVVEDHRQAAEDQGLYLRLRLPGAREGGEKRGGNEKREAGGAAMAARARLDAGGLRRALDNLIGNAIKFTQEGGVTVTVVRSGREEEGEVHVCVEDTGIGIGEAFREEGLFAEFRQESAERGRAHDGSGLGLAITRRLIEGMGGRIEVESEKGEGTAFVVSFPAAAAPPEAKGT